MNNEVVIYDNMPWSNTPCGTPFMVTDENTCNEWVGNITYQRKQEIERYAPFFINGKEIFRATAIVWSGCPCDTPHFGYRMEV